MAMMHARADSPRLNVVARDAVNQVRHERGEDDAGMWMAVGDAGDLNGVDDPQKKNIKQ